MALLNQSLLVAGQLPKLFETLRQGQAPTKFNREFLKDIGFKSSNHLAFIPLLKGLGFLSADGSPTQRYRDFLDSTRSSKVIAEALNEAYGDIFIIKARPTKADRKMIAGKYKSTYNMSDTTADRAAATFLALLDLADEATLYGEKEEVAPSVETATQNFTIPTPSAPPTDRISRKPASLHYNIQIHLPATKDVEVYNAIFKSLKEHILD